MATQQEVINFINQIGPIVQKYAKQFGYKIASPVIAQACLESGYGTLPKAKRHNYFGLKYRPNRCPSACGTFVDGSSEQLSNGQYYAITDQWFAFKNMEDGVKGYFEFISVSNYDVLRKVNPTDPKQFLQILKDCKYATSLKYVDNNYRVIEKNNLTRFDNFSGTVTPATPVTPAADTKPVLKSNEEIAKEVLKGSWGNGQERIDKLTKAGYNYKEVQAIVDKINPAKQKANNAEFQEGEMIKLDKNATYYNGKKIPNWVKGKQLYYRGKNDNGIIFSTKKTGDITGVVDLKFVSKA